MIQNQFRRQTMIKHNVSDTFNRSMPGNSDCGNGKGMIKRRIDRNQTFDASTQKHLGILFDQVLSASMMGREIEVSGIHELIADATYDLIVVSFGEVRYQNSDAQGSTIAERTRKETRLIVEFFGCCFDTIASCLGNGTTWHFVKNDRNRCRMQPQMLSQLF